MAVVGYGGVVFLSRISGHRSSDLCRIVNLKRRDGRSSRCPTACELWRDRSILTLIHQSRLAASNLLSRVIDRRIIASHDLAGIIDGMSQPVYGVDLRHLTVGVEE
jgi:hypothetical protein